MSEPPGWYRAPKGWEDDGAAEPPAVEPTPAPTAPTTTGPDEPPPGGSAPEEPVGDRTAADGSSPAPAGAPSFETIRTTALLFDAEPTRTDDHDGYVGVGPIEVEFTGLPESTVPPGSTVPTGPASVATPAGDTRSGDGPNVVPASPTPDRGTDRRRTIVIGMVVALVVLVLAVVVVESLGRMVLQGIVGGDVRSAGVAADADVRVGRSWWTPSISRALLTGNLDRVDIALRSSDVVGIPAESIHYSLSDLGVSVSVLHRRVRVASLGSGRVRATIDPRSMADVLGVPVEIRGGGLRIGGSAEEASVSIVGTDLVIRDPQLIAVTGSDAVSFPVSDPYMLPCDPRADIRGDRLVLACSGSRLPGVVSRAFGGSDDPAGVEPDTGADVEIYAPGPIEAGD